MNAESNSGPCCVYCGLPIVGIDPSPAQRESPEATERLYCCFGCRFAASIAEAGGEAGQARWAMVRLGLAVFFTMNVVMFTMALWSQDWPDPTGNNASGSALLFNDLFRWLTLLFAVPPLILLGGPLIENALDELGQGRLTTDLLLAVGVLASFLYSLAAVWQGTGHLYFEVGCVVLVCVTLGRWLEATGKLKTTAALQSLAQLLPKTVSAWRCDRFTEIPLPEVVVGDRLRIFPGERIPTDARIERGAAGIDAQLLTGESEPILKEAGNTLQGGTLNLDGDLVVIVTAPPSGGTLQRLMDAVRRAATTKGRYQRLADSVSAWFFPAVVLVAIASFAAHTYWAGTAEGLLACLAVLVIACPCALGIATPLALWAGLGRAAKSHILFRDGDSLTRLTEVRAICFDKTGTLTTGEPQVVGMEGTTHLSESELRAMARVLASVSRHRLAHSLESYCVEQDVSSDADFELPDPWEVITVPGRGIHASWVDGREAMLGSIRWMDEQGLAWETSLRHSAQQHLAEGHPVVCFAWNGHVQGIAAFREELRRGVETLVAWARQEGLILEVLTGDTAAQGAALETRLGIAVRAGLLPEEKLAEVERLRKVHGAVAMIGDGANDAPALAGADVGIALGCGADVSRQSADVCLLGSDLLRLVEAIHIARETIATIRWNLFASLVYNVVGLGLAAAGWLHPAVAAAAMVVSSVVVVSQSLRLGSGQFVLEDEMLRTNIAAESLPDAARLDLAACIESVEASSPRNGNPQHV